MMGRAWTTGEKRRLHELRAQRVPVKDIAAELNRSVDGIYSFLRYVPATREQPARMTKVPRVAFQWNEFAIAQVRDMADGGATLKQAAERMRVSIKCVRHMASKQGIQFGPRKVDKVEKEIYHANRDAKRGSAMLLEALLKLAA